jgi:ABC-type branched-subunit amino acid transport system substrate-binding protein
MATTRLRRLAALLLAVGLLMVGCRGGGETGGDSAAEESEGDTTSSEPAEEGSEEESEAAPEITFDVGVTEEPCPEAVNEDHGCIYLGTISDLTAGPFRTTGPDIVAAQEAFWNRVNEDGGIGDAFDVNVTEYVADNLYNPETHVQVYQEMEPNILAMAQTLGSPTTAAILPNLEEDQVVAAPASWTSLWAFEDQILESGNTYCIESMNAIDYAVENFDGIESVLAIGYPGDYGEDGIAGARVASEANGLAFTELTTNPGQDNQAGAIDAIVSQNPSVVMLTTGPAEMATIIGQAAAQGFTGRFIGNGPTWQVGVLDSPAAPAIEAQYTLAGPWAPYDADTPGHQAMREALGEEGVESFTSGWAWSYPLLAVLEQAAANGDLTRAGLVDAVTQVEEVDYEGMLPEGSGNYAGEPNDQLVRGTFISQVDRETVSGVATLTEEAYTGPTAEAFELGEAACYQQ